MASEVDYSGGEYGKGASAQGTANASLVFTHTASPTLPAAAAPGATPASLGNDKNDKIRTVFPPPLVCSTHCLVAPPCGLSLCWLL